ncbi:MAG: caspase family protein, partial [Candidatus Eremiobacterota bacterium]
MKRFSFLVLALVLLSYSLASAQTGNKRWALIIGIGKYPEAAGVENFNYVENDIQGMETLFREKFAVPAENITVIKDEHVTKEGVKNAIADMAGRVSE